MEKFIFTPDIEDNPTDLTWEYGHKEYNIASRSQLLFIGGDRGAYKSSFCRALIASALNDNGYMGFKYKANGKKVVLIDTELSATFFNRGLADLLKMSGVNKFPSNFEPYCLNIIADPIQRRDTILNYVEKNKGDIDILVLDGIGDIVAEESNTQEANLIINSLSALVDIHDAMGIITSHTSDAGKLLSILGRKLGRKARVGFILLNMGGSVLVIPDKTSWEKLPVSEFSVTADRQLVQGDYIPFPIFQKQKIF